MGQRVTVIGGGLAGLAAAIALASRGFEVVILESRGRLGGRASSFRDVTSGQLVDTCQHVVMGCCTNFAHFCRSVGTDVLLQTQPCMYFMTPDRIVSRFAADSLPAPFHLLRGFLGAHYLSLREKMRVARGLISMQRSSPDSDPPFDEWLRQHGQTQRTIARFWGPVLISALNELPERVGLRYARKVFVDGFLRHRRAFEMDLPRVPLGELYGERLLEKLKKLGIQLRLQTAAKCLEIENSRVTALVLRSDEKIESGSFISAVPFDRLLDLLPAEVAERHPEFDNLRRLETSPITSIHIWYDRPVLDLPHVVLVDGIGQWVFNRGEVLPGEHYLQVVVSAARQFRGLSQAEIEKQIIAELAARFPRASPDAVRRVRVITEHAATFSAVPGVDAWRPAQQTPIANLLLAGDWTKTDWPATMEGAVRSGYLAAEALLRSRGEKVKLLQPDL
jgi:squalene-associated FAD-dependent desaturase